MTDLIPTNAMRIMLEIGEKMTKERYEKMSHLIEDEKAFLWSQALQIARKTEDAEDLFQDTIMKVCLYFTNFEDDTNFRAWARKIMINVHINRIRKKMYNTLPLEDSYLNSEDVSPVESGNISNMEDPEKVYFHNHISEEILDLFYSAPQKYQNIFTLFHINGYHYDEISRKLGVPIGTVKSRIHRAKRTLSVSMSNNCTNGNICAG